jgi:hypothetical protein
MKPLHESTQHANSTLYWIPPDTQSQYQSNLKHTDNRRMLEQFGWIDQTIKYTFNSDGFRTQEFDDRKNFVAIGCSFTQGTGVNESERWTTLLSQQLDLWCWNLGIAGASSDTCYRVARYYLQRLDPAFVVFLEPRPNRIELHDDPAKPPHLINWTYNLGDWGSGPYVKTMLANDENLEIRAEKNKAAIGYVCAQLNIPIVMYAPDDYRDRIDDKTQLDLGRDLLHPGRLNNQAFAKVVYNDVKNI